MLRMYMYDCILYSIKQSNVTGITEGMVVGALEFNYRCVCVCACVSVTVFFVLILTYFMGLDFILYLPRTYIEMMHLDTTLSVYSSYYQKPNVLIQC